MGAAMKPWRWTPPWIIFLWLASSFGLHAQDRILILSSGSSQVEDFISTFREELDGQFDIHQEVVPTRPTATSYERFDLYLRDHKPHLIVLLNNAAVFDYKRFQINNPSRTDLPPAAACMVSYLDQEIEGIRNITGIAYEVPAITSFNFVRGSIGKRVEKVGVIYRKRFEDFIEQQGQFAEQEAFNLVGYAIEDDEKNMTRAIRRALKQLIDREKIDALWVLNDNALINNTTLNRAWLPRLRGVRIPIVVGVDPLIRLEGFGNFAVLPDHESLAYEFAGLVIELHDNAWQLNSSSFVRRVPSKQIIRIDFARKYLQFIEGKRQEIDETIP